MNALAKEVLEGVEKANGLNLLEEQEILREALQRFNDSENAEIANREAALEDLYFLTGDQWPAEIRNKRAQAKRPCLSINLLPKFVRQVTGDARQNRPSIEVHPVDSEADPLTAQIFEGIIRNIDYVSNASVARDTALDHAAKAGWGYYRIVTQPADLDSFRTDIRIKRIVNQFSVYFDPGVEEADYSDARYCFVIEDIPRDEFERLYPKAVVVSFSTGLGDTFQKWWSQDSVRLAEYWVKEPLRKTVALVQGVIGGQPAGDPVVVEVDTEFDKSRVQVIEVREVDTYQVRRYLMTAAEVIEVMDWPGRYIPVIPVLGEETFVEGRRVLSGIVRDAKDPQRLNNYWITMATEKIGLTSRAPWLGTAEMFEGHETEWDDSSNSPRMRLIYNIDPAAPAGARPTRIDPAQTAPGEAQMLEYSARALMDTTGIYESRLGQQANEQSGKAILARQASGEVNTFLYPDNLARAVAYEGKILVDLIPKVYDAERIVRTRGKDGKVMVQEVNTIKRLSHHLTQNPEPDEEIHVMGSFGKPVRTTVGQAALSGHDHILVDRDGSPIPWNDLTVGKYDAVVSVGPSYKTQREKAADSMIRLVEALIPVFPAIGQVLVPRIAKNLDWEGAEDIAKELEAMIKGGPGGGPPGGAVPPEIAAALQNAQPAAPGGPAPAALPPGAPEGGANG